MGILSLRHPLISLTEKIVESLGCILCLYFKDVNFFYWILVCHHHHHRPIDDGSSLTLWMSRGRFIPVRKGEMCVLCVLCSCLQIIAGYPTTSEEFYALLHRKWCTTRQHHARAGGGWSPCWRRWPQSRDCYSTICWSRTWCTQFTKQSARTSSTPYELSITCFKSLQQILYQIMVTTRCELSCFPEKYKLKFEGAGWFPMLD